MQHQTYSIEDFYPSNHDIADDCIGVGQCENCGKVTQLFGTDWGASWCEVCLCLKNNSPSE